MYISYPVLWQLYVFICYSMAWSFMQSNLVTVRILLQDSSGVSILQQCSKTQAKEPQPPPLCQVQTSDIMFQSHPAHMKPKPFPLPLPFPFLSVWRVILLGERLASEWDRMSIQHTFPSNQEPLRQGTEIWGIGTPHFLTRYYALSLLTNSTWSDDHSNLQLNLVTVSVHVDNEHVDSKP